MKTLLLSDPLKAADLLEHGELVALPTETVYGLAGNATLPEIVKKIFIAKERPSFDPLIVHFSQSFLNSASPIEELVQKGILSNEILSWKNRSSLEKVMKIFWPGPLTIVLPKGNLIPNEVTSNQKTVGIRCPLHPMFQKVLSLVPFPLAAPSANRFGRISPTHANHVMKELEGRIAGVLDGGPCEVGVESTIIQFSENEVHLLRPGKISKSELETVLGSTIQLSPSLMEKISEFALAPGMLDEHYAPRKPLYLIPASFQDQQSLKMIQAIPNSFHHSTGWISMSGFHPNFPNLSSFEVRVLSLQKSTDEMARKLFSTMRELDENPKITQIITDIPENIQEGLGASIGDRLRRASRNKPALPF
jgi:L-threonylcarbamoyladenylate synthase